MTKRKPLNLKLKKGALHKTMDIDENEKLPKTAISKLAKAKPGTKVPVNGKKVTATKLTKKRAQFAKNAAKWKKGGKK